MRDEGNMLLGFSPGSWLLVIEVFSAFRISAFLPAPGFWILDSGYCLSGSWILDSGFCLSGSWILAPGYCLSGSWILDSGFCLTEELHMLEAVLSLGGIGLSASLILGVLARKFAVEVDPREAAILDVLSAANCGACAYPGCGAYAKAVASGEAAVNLCTPGGQKTISQIADILGVTAIGMDPQVAIVLCQGDDDRATSKYRYLGIADCNAAQRVAGGPKECPGGCLGLGTCARVCPFDAIEMSGAGLAVISREKCTGCRKCVSACPRNVIRMTPVSSSVHVLCNSRDKGGQVRKYCKIGCIACHICVKTAPGAYVMEDNLARVVYEDSAQTRVAMEKCPTKCIRDFCGEQDPGARIHDPE
jgi:Na+-translocating ferredoxin:NAD+ oxidoreductase subunit B